MGIDTGSQGSAAEPVHFLLHVPKCAGTTVESHFSRALGPGFLLAPRWDSVLRNVIGNRYAFAPGDPKLAPVRVVSGHSLSRSLAAAFDGREIRESVLIRDPLGFLLSFYNYRVQRHEDGHGGPPPDFERWYLAQRRNPVARFILNRYFEQGIPALYRRSSAARLAWLEARLTRFWFVAGYHRASEMIAGISRELGLPETVASRNVTRARRIRADDLPAALRDRIANENALDQTLYERWRERGWQQDADPPMGPRPALPRGDQIRTAVGEIASGIRKTLMR